MCTRPVFPATQSVVISPLMEEKILEDEDAIAARAILSKTGLSLVDAARLVLDLKEAAGRARKVESLRRVIRLGGEALKKSRATVSFYRLYEEFFRDNDGLRSRTVGDYRQILGRTAERYPNFWKWRVRRVSTEDIHEILRLVFPTPRQRFKARAVFHALFSYAEKRRWIAQNPVSSILPPRLKEQEIIPLSLPEIHRLLFAARTVDNGECLAPIAIMLFAGIRPREVERLSWGDIDFEEGVISVASRHAKTGGARHVTILKPLREILSECLAKINTSELPRKRITPLNWEKRWKGVRLAAGWSGEDHRWQQDVLRHTFASYHAKYFKNFQLLQCEMGHANANLLRTRYISMCGVTRVAAAQFWNAEVLGITLPRVVFKLSPLPLLLCCGDENFRC